MKLKDNFLLRPLADAWIGIPFIDGVWEMQRMLTLNETGIFLWKLLETETDMGSLASALCAEYGIPLAEACADVQMFCQKLNAAGFLDN